MLQEGLPLGQREEWSPRPSTRAYGSTFIPASRMVAAGDVREAGVSAAC